MTTGPSRSNCESKRSCSHKWALARPNGKLKWANPPPRVMALPHIVKRIEELALTLKEMVEEAVREGEVQLLKELVADFGGDVATAVLVAARLGRVDMLEILFDSKATYFYDEESGCKYKEDDDDFGPFVVEAVVVASRRGHQEAVRYLHDKILYCSDRFETWWRILEEGAARGHAEVVKYAVESICSFDEGAYEEYTPDRSWDNCRALALAISGGHGDVVDVLLHGSAPCWDWDIKGAFEQALKEGHEDIAWSIYDTFHDRLSRYGDDELVVQMVRDGRTHAVKNLCKTDFGLEQIGDVLMAAVQAGKFKTIEFLLGTGRVPPKTIDWAFEEAARYGFIDAVKLLYNHQRISQQAISKAFEFASSLAVFNYLHDMDHISLDALAAAFERVTQPIASPRSEHDPPDMPSEDRVEIIKLLCDTGCIPPELIGKAFVRAARKGYTNVVEALQDDECVDTMATTKAFICACYHGHTAIVKVLCGKEGLSSDSVARSFEVAASRGHTGIVEVLSRRQRLSPAVVAELVEKEAVVGFTHLIKGLHSQEHVYLDAIADGLVNAATKAWSQVGPVYNGKDLSCEVVCEVFMKAAGRGCLDIVQNLFRDHRITCAIKHEAFIKASRRGEKEVMKFFDASARWSLETLNQALEATRDLDILHYLCKKIGEALARNQNKTKKRKRRRIQ